MKKMLAALLILLFLPVCALGDGLVAAKEDAALAQALSLNGSTQESRLDCLIRVILGEADAALITQQELIEALQGYAEGDVRTDIQAAAVLAQNDLYLVCSADTARETGISDLKSLRDYLIENEYSLMLMRCFQASNADYASLLLMEEMAFDSDIFVDEKDKTDQLASGAYVLCTDTEGALALAQDGYTVLGALTKERTAEFPDLPCAEECGLPVIPGTCFLAVMQAGADPAPYQNITIGEEDLAALHLHAPDPDFSLADTIASYVEYMTQEGLFFY